MQATRHYGAEVVLRGHTVSETPMPSGLQAIQRGMKNGHVVWLGGADPRREGIVAGD